MKLLLAILCLASLALAIKFDKPTDISKAKEENLWKKFLIKYNKDYPTQDEYALRFENFKASLQRIAQRNALSKGATYAINKFSDLSREEFKTKILMKNKIITLEENRNKPSDQVLVPKSIPTAPQTYDWRALGAVTPVKDQGQCGSCWAFSVTENVESAWILKGHGSNSTVDLAPQQIVDCDTTDEGCNGGDPPTAYAYLMSAGGLEPEADYPYTAEDGSCSFNKNDVAATISNWKYATSGYSETLLQQNLLSWGPLSICVDAEYWQDYSGGVMTWEECAWVNELDHCVELVGYDSTGSTPHWIVRNSWGTDWGVEGYILLEMWKDTCGLTYEATSSVI